MGGSALQFPDSMLDSVSVDGDAVTLAFKPLYMQKSEGIPGVDASTRWEVEASLLLRETESGADLAGLSGRVTTARLRINQYTWVDVVPLPVDGPGLIRLELTVEGSESPLVVEAGSANFMPRGQEKYLEHIDGQG